MKFIPILFLLVVFNSQAQGHRKGEMYLYWGWNRSAYTNSDIHFWGNNYNFTLDNVIAKDRQSPFTFKLYFNPTTVTIPQYNFRIGYYLNEKYDISFGADHMKYVMRNYETVAINGFISESDTQYDGYYSNDSIVLNPDFLLFEHTDGLNYENIELRRSDIWYSKPKFRIESRLGAGIGILIPRTNTTLLNNERYDEFHVAGYGLGIVAGVHFSFFNHFFIQFEGKPGFIHMPDIRTTQSVSDKASQSFFFLQGNMVFGGNFNLFKEKKSE